MTLQELHDFLKEAEHSEDIFGIDIAHSYRSYVKICYPDLVSFADKSLAEETFRTLQDWRKQADSKTTAGTYGDKSVSFSSSPPNPPYVETTFKLDSKEVKLVALLGEGLISSIHRATVTGADSKRQFFVKIAKHPKDNDLLEREYRNLMILFRREADPTIEQFCSIQRKYVPKPEGMYYVTGSGGTQRRFLLLSTVAGEAYTLDNLLKMPKFKHGIVRQNMYWIYRRLLMTLVFSHSKKIIHGAVTPNHVLVFPKEHGLVLLDWSTSTWQDKEHIPVVDPDWKSFYPPETFLKKKTEPNVDLYLATQTMLHCSLDLPKKIDNILQKCITKEPENRPEEVLPFYETFERVMIETDGPKKYFEMEI